MSTHADSVAPSILVVSRGGHPGVDDALRQMHIERKLRVAKHVTINGAGNGTLILSELPKLVSKLRIDFVIFHHYHSPALPDPTMVIKEIRSQAHQPLTVFSCGDPFYNGFFRPSHTESFKSISAAVDLVLTTSMGESADAIVGYGAKRVVLFPNGACQVRFPKLQEPHQPSIAEHDVVFIGSNNRSRNPTRSYFWYSRRREQLVRQLFRRFGDRFAVFGHGWDSIPAARGPISFSEQIRVCRSARVVVGGVPYSPARYYTSNRPFNQITSGVPFVDLGVPGAKALLRDGEHWHLSDTTTGVGDRVQDLLDRSDAERVAMGEEAATFVYENHTHAHRWRWLVDTLQVHRNALISGDEPAVPRLQFLLPEARLETEYLQATRGWVRADQTAGT